MHFEEKDIWKIFIQITRGLKSLHELNILHRDFKPANIFLFAAGAAKIGDLNVSKILNKSLGHTQTGTPYYASPEVWNNSPYDCKSDIWSLGCILYEMLTLNPPFHADDFDGLYKKVMAGKYNKINDRYSEDMNELLKLLFKVNPKERPSCSEILKLDLIKKRIDYFKTEAGLDLNDIDNLDDNELLKTIRLSQNILGLIDKLPKPNYSLPKININFNKAKINNNINELSIKREALTTSNNNDYLANRIKTLNGKNNAFINKINNFSNNNIAIVKKIRLNNEQTELNNSYKNKGLYNLYSDPRYNIHINSINNKFKKTEEKKNFNLNIKKKNNSINDKRIFDTYKLYLSKDVRKFLSKNKKYKLPKIIMNKKTKNIIVK